MGTFKKPSPLEEIKERISESLPALEAAKQAVGLEDHRRMLADHARRVMDSHRAQMQAAGTEPSSEGVDEAMGDIVITGDIVTIGEKKQPQAEQPKPQNDLQEATRALQDATQALAACIQGQAKKPASLAAKASTWPLIASALFGSLGGAGIGAWTQAELATPVVQHTVVQPTAPGRDYQIEKWDPTAPSTEKEKQ